MPTFRVRSVAPKESTWSDVVAESIAEGVQAWHAKNAPLGFCVSLPREKAPTVSFVCVVVEGHGELISRYYYDRIRLRGGVKPRDPMTIEKIAKMLSWHGDPQELLEPGWEAESETWE